ncbi:type II/IV secretion system protein [Candidatus Saccharibacteria bacterium]|nr:type II/IV secretion system protein [Candidatus Saccharibacteria bacterium]
MSQDARRDEELNTQRRAQILGLNYIDTSQITDKILYKELLDTQELYNLRVIPLRADSHNVTFGVTNTTSQTTMENLRHRFLDQRVAFGLISDVGFREYMRLYDPPKTVEYKDISINEAGKEDIVAAVSSTLEQVRADDMLAYLVQQAHKLNSSDIHMETQKEYVRVRFRIDGVLHPIAKISNEKYRILISAIASAGNVSTASDEAQQGHIAQRVRMADGSEVDINLRLETVPTITGMDVVMRLFNMDQEMYQLDKLGLSEQERAVVDGIVSKPNGLVLVVGPTGSGKTTTLYSMLNTLNTEEHKVITIEDPVEYQFEGITQITVSTKSSQEISFAEKLRAVLRLDPDIVMVGEIRDMDTAKTALQAALTGHLVLSTFHAGSAAAALTRLADIIGQNPLFVSAIRLVMAQRLVRRLDDDCKTPYTPDETTLQSIQEIVDGLPEGIEKPDLSNLQLYEPGSSEDNPYGFKGQIVLREQFLMEGDVVKVLRGDHNPSVQEIEKAAIESGMRTMLQDGILKVIAGETTLQEVYRVIG